MRLVLPNDYTAIRLVPDGITLKSPGVWHILKDGKEQTTICGLVLPLVETEKSLVSNPEVKKLCTLCWPYGVEK